LFITIGIGVALSVLGNNNSSLIGVAISASLLPPAVNCGMALAFALVLSLAGGGGGGASSDHTPQDFLALGGLSLALTVINIGAIFLAALGMFRLKEVAPVVNKVAFWNEDVKICRGLNKQQKQGVAKQWLLKGQQKRGRASSASPSPSPFSCSSSSFSSPYQFLSPSRRRSHHDHYHQHNNRHHHHHHHRHPHRRDALHDEEDEDDDDGDNDYATNKLDVSVDMTSLEIN
jgi:hypothetical protein